VDFCISGDWKKIVLIEVESYVLQKGKIFPFKLLSRELHTALPLFENSLSTCWFSL
jgi:hypothetical protein